MRTNEEPLVSSRFEGRTTKKCSSCGLELAFDAFYQNANHGTAYSQAMQPCKACRVEKVKERNSTPVARREIRSRNLQRNYGISIEEYEVLEKAQRGLCAICGSPPPGSGRNQYLHVDHDHETGDVRGLLCHLCNLGLGSFRDRGDLLKSAIDYLNREG
jgi:Recombination endonuclease VII